MAETFTISSVVLIFESLSSGILVTCRRFSQPSMLYLHSNSEEKSEGKDNTFDLVYLGL